MKTAVKIFVASLLLVGCTAEVIDERHVLHCVEYSYTSGAGGAAGDGSGGDGGADAGP